MIKYVRQKRERRFFEGISVRIDELKSKGAAMPLVLAPIGAQMKIVKIIADDKTKKHLANLGVMAQAEITVLSSSGGSTVCIVKDGRLALDRDVASRIFVA